MMGPCPWDPEKFLQAVGLHQLTMEPKMGPAYQLVQPVFTIAILGGELATARFCGL
jgi:hypothetical protein